MWKGFKVADADAHHHEPPYLWDRYVDAEFRDRVPKVIGVRRNFFVYEPEGAALMDIDPSTIERDDFDPREIVEFHDLINRQDWGICERAQMGQRSRAYRCGVYPPQDEWVYEFDQHYLRERGPEPGAPAPSFPSSPARRP